MTLASSRRVGMYWSLQGARICGRALSTSRPRSGMRSGRFEPQNSGAIGLHVRLRERSIVRDFRALGRKLETWSLHRPRRAGEPAGLSAILPRQPATHPATTLQPQMSNDYLFTSESVSERHPDKMAD